MNMADFSEFSYGYALTDNILHSGLPHSSYAPVFLSHFAEGQPGGGYDVMIPLKPVPLFLQFKIPQVVRKRSNQTPPDYNVPYLRMHLRTWRPNQHQLMLDLENSGKLVYYATPTFWSEQELDVNFTNGRVHEFSWYIRPTRVGVLDEKPHYVAYRSGNSVGWRHSEMEKLNGHFHAENFAREIDAAVQKARPQEPLEFLNRVKNDIVKITQRQIQRLPPQAAQPQDSIRESVSNKAAVEDSATKDIKRRRHLIRQAMREVAYLSQVRLGCSFLVTGAN
jgi:hypothetical protein